MTDQNKIVIIGGHGKVALLAAPKLKAAGYAVDSIIRNPGHEDAVRAAGANPVVLDIESADVDAMASAFRGAHAVVFSAGAGGKEGGMGEEPMSLAEALKEKFLKNG